MSFEPPPYEPPDEGGSADLSDYEGDVHLVSVSGADMRLQNDGDAAGIVLAAPTEFGQISIFAEGGIDLVSKTILIGTTESGATTTIDSNGVVVKASETTVSIQAYNDGGQVNLESDNGTTIEAINADGAIYFMVGGELKAQIDSDLKFIASSPGGRITLTDAEAEPGSGNGLFWTSGDGDGATFQGLTVSTGVGGVHYLEFQADGILKVDGDPVAMAADVPSGTTVDKNTQTASYVLALADAGKVVEMNVASGNTLTVPANATIPFPIGTILEVFQYGAGQTTITPDGGVTIRSNGGKLKLTGQYSSAVLRKRDTDEWVAAGDLSA